MTVLKSISPNGASLEPFVIWKGAEQQLNWYDGQGSLSKGWSFAVSPNGWTNSDLEYHWLTIHFEPNTRPNPDEWQLLLVDGHKSHVAWPFQEFCMKNWILLVTLPPHMTHWIQPLDVGVFSALGH